MSIKYTAIRGVVEGGHIRLLEPVELADGTVVEVKIPEPTLSDSARERQCRLLREGIHLGGPPYPKREDLYER